MNDIKEKTLKNKKLATKTSILLILVGVLGILTTNLNPISVVHPYLICINLFLILKSVKNIICGLFCLNCGAIVSSGFFKTYDYCPKCGKPYNEKEQVKE